MFIFLPTFYCFGQEYNVTKFELNKVFRKSIIQESRKSIFTLSNPWVTDNTDSLYYKAEVIKLTNFKSSPERVNFCNKVNWTFYKNNNFIFKESQTCNEPSSSKVVTEKDWIEIILVKSESKLILELYNVNTLIEKFEVISLDYSELKIDLTLRRMKKTSR